VTGPLHMLHMLHILHMLHMLHRLHIVRTLCAGFRGAFP
jgi:hypothetical protein